LSKITFAELRRILRGEKSISKLQRLDEDIYENIKEKIKELKAEQRSAIENENLGHIAILQKEEEGIRKSFEELYNTRESKIIKMAMVSARTKKEQNFEDMLEFEKNMFEEMVKLLKNYRNDVFYGKKEKKIEEVKVEKEKKEENRKVLIRIVEKIPPFVGVDMKNYGPYEKSDVAFIPEENAKVLIKKNLAIEIKMEEKE